jgi:hypothetical protein
LNHPIVRLFGTAQQAADALKKLSAEGYTDDLITLVGPQTAATTEGLAANIAAAYVVHAEARMYAPEVAKGKYLVIVRAPFSAGGKAEKILDKFAPLPAPVAAVADRALLWDEAAPISSALRIPVLSTGFFSTFWTLPVLTSWEARLPFPELTKSTSNTKLSSNPTPLSSLLHIPLLT